MRNIKARLGIGPRRVSTEMSLPALPAARRGRSKLTETRTIPPLNIDSENAFIKQTKDVFFDLFWLMIITDFFLGLVLWGSWITGWFIH